jgi:nucleotide-binding universal stress UspA family protein
MFRSVLVPLDGSPRAEAVLPWIQAHFPTLEEILLFHCVPEGGGYPPVVDRERYLNQVNERLSIPGRTILRTGPAPERIVTASLEFEVDAVALSFGPEIGASSPLGSVADSVARTSPKPVLFLGPQTLDRPRRIRRILVPVDETRELEDELGIVRRLTRGSGIESIFLHVADSSIPPDEGEEEACRMTWDPSPATRLNLIRCVQALHRDGMGARAVVSMGDPLTEILSHEASLDVDLILLAKEGHEDLHRWRPVVAHAQSVVLLVAASVREPSLLPIKRL